jgi:selenium metabolism protein YedF
MPKIIDARGLLCPKPVMLTKKALDSDKEFTVIVDNRTAAENVSMFARSKGCRFEMTEKSEREFQIDVFAGGNWEKKEPGPVQLPEGSAAPLNEGLYTVVFSSETMGRGDDKLGETIMKAFVHTLSEADIPPESMVFYNGGVKLAAEGSDVLDDLRSLEKRGVRILVCGTCVNFYGLTGKIGAGTVSNMFDILTVLTNAAKIIQP